MTDYQEICNVGLDGACLMEWNIFNSMLGLAFSLFIFYTVFMFVLMFIDAGKGRKIGKMLKFKKL